MSTEATSTDTDSKGKAPSDGPIRITIEIERPGAVFAELGPRARGAAREAILTLRSALDLALRFVDGDLDDDDSPPRGPTRIKIE